MIKNLPDEEIVNSIDSNRLILTNKRLMYYDNINYDSIRLVHISFVSYSFRRFPKILLYTFFITILLIILVMIESYTKGYTNDDAILIPTIGFILGIIIYLCYTRKELKISTSGGLIRINLQGIGKGYIEEFIGQIENEIDKLITKQI